MSFNLERVRKVSAREVEEAAALTAMGFGREAGEENYLDTQAHLEGADDIQFLRSNGDMVAFAAYRRTLWQSRV